MMTTAIVKVKQNRVRKIDSGYAGLRDRVKARLVLGRRRVEEEKVRTYWDVGRMIDQHVMTHNRQAAFGKQVIKKLSQDLDISRKVLYRTVQFARTFPNVAGRRHLTWSHYRALLTVRDGKKRKILLERTYKHGWNAEELEVQIRSLRAKAGERKSLPHHPLAKPEPGRLYTYRVFEAETMSTGGRPVARLDLGFQMFKDMAALDAAPGDVVASEKSGGGYRTTVLKEATSRDVYTYEAVVERVVDGDTLRTHIDLGFGMWTRQYLRLAYINAPEMKTRAGEEARAFVVRMLKPAAAITVRTTGRDPHGRYIAEVTYGRGRYLNQEILDAGHAVRM